MKMTFGVNTSQQIAFDSFKESTLSRSEVRPQLQLAGCFTPCPIEFVDDAHIFSGILPVASDVRL